MLIANRQHFIHQQDIGSTWKPKSQPHIHT
jgi:hypothetical protein